MLRFNFIFKPKKKKNPILILIIQLIIIIKVLQSIYILQNSGLSEGQRMKKNKASNYDVIALEFAPIFVNIKKKIEKDTTCEMTCNIETISTEFSEEDGDKRVEFSRSFNNNNCSSSIRLI